MNSSDTRLHGDIYREAETKKNRVSSSACGDDADMTNSNTQHHVIGARTDIIDLPEGLSVKTMAYTQCASNLCLRGSDGPIVIVRDYFSNAQPPTLRTTDGVTISGNLARILVGLSEPAISILLANQQNRPVTTLAVQ